MGKNKLCNENNNDKNQDSLLRIIERDGVLELYLRGTFTSPRENSEALTVLDTLADEYDTIEITINSAGGDLGLLTAILSILKKFKNVITIGESDIASAGAMLWASGDVRIIKNYTSFMIHRESYFKGYDKTENHYQEAIHNRELYSLLMNDIFDGILSDKEIETAKLSEVWLTPAQLLERGVCISYDDFLMKKYLEEERIEIIGYGDNYFFRNNDGTLSPVTEFDVDFNTSIKECQLRYNHLEIRDEYDYISDRKDPDVVEAEILTNEK